MKTALVLVPHPDDEVFCYGICKDFDCHYVVFSDTRLDEWKAAHKYEDKVTFLNLKDTQFYETKNAWKIAMKACDDLFERKRPALVLAPARSHDRDHQFVNDVARCMVRENGNNDFSYEFLEYGYPACLAQGWSPDNFFGVSNGLEEQKMTLWSKYASQHKRKLDSWFTQSGLLEFDRGMGRIVGFPYAECYKHVFSKKVW